MADYVLTHKAVEDLSEIWAYTGKRWSGRQAELYYTLLVTACEELAKDPEKGKEYNEIADGIRGYGAGKHVLFYREMMRDKVQIIRILNGRMDLKSKMHEPER